MPGQEKSALEVPILGNPDIIIKTTAVFVTLSFIVSYCYQAGFLSRLGLYFSRVPVSLADISRDALASIPQIFMLLLVALSMDAMLRRPKLKEGDDDFNASEKRKIFFHNLGFAILMTMAFSAFGWFTGSLLIYAFPIPIWYSLLRRVGKLKRIYRLGIPVFIAIILAFTMGYFNANAVIINPMREVITTSDKSKETIAILNTYEKGVLVVDGPVLRLIRWEEVKEIEYPRPSGIVPGVCALGNARTTPFCKLYVP